MANTAGGLPYVEPSDLLSGWPAVSQDLAEELDSQLAAKASLAGATYTGTHNFTGATVTGVAGGLTLITAQSFTTASAVNVNNCFTSTYDNYTILLQGVGSTSITATNLRLRVSGVDASSADYRFTRNDLTGVYSGTVSTGATSIHVGFFDNTFAYGYQMIVQRPASAARTGIWTTGFRGDTAAMSNCGGEHSLTTAYDGFSLIPAAGTITGTLRVYGYRNS